MKLVDSYRRRATLARPGPAAVARDNQREALIDARRQSTSGVEKKCLRSFELQMMIAPATGRRLFF
jgi:hypothetical protein